MSPRREDFGAWLEGTPGGMSPGRVTGLRLPEAGPGSLTPLGRRAVALVVDWGLSMAVASLFWPDPTAVGPWVLGAEPWATLLVFVVSTAVLVGLLGYTVGHRALGLRVARLVSMPDPAPVGPDGESGPERMAAPGPPGLAVAALRTVLVALVIPPVVWDRSGRGMHDLAARTVIVRR